jgi:hypothetical protein
MNTSRSPVGLMRISEFNRAAGVYRKRSFIACIAPFAIALVCLITYAPFQQRFESFLSARLDAFAVDVLSVLPMAVPTVLALILIIPLARRIERQLGIPCPHCGKALANHQAIVIASRNCPCCGKRVIQEAP